MKSLRSPSVRRVWRQLLRHT